MLWFAPSNHFQTVTALATELLRLSDQQFEASYAGSANACALREVQDIYWTRVQALQQRVKGFWLPEDVAELEDLKAQRRQALSGLLPNQ
jgi:hypothetical protein